MSWKWSSCPVRGPRARVVRALEYISVYEEVMSGHAEGIRTCVWDTPVCNPRCRVWTSTWPSYIPVVILVPRLSQVLPSLRAPWRVGTHWDEFLFRLIMDKSKTQPNSAVTPTGNATPMTNARKGRVVSTSTALNSGAGNLAGSAKGKPQTDASKARNLGAGNLAGSTKGKPQADASKAHNPSDLGTGVDSSNAGHPWSLVQHRKCKEKRTAAVAAGPTPEIATPHRKRCKPSARKRAQNRILREASEQATGSAPVRPAQCAAVTAGPSQPAVTGSGKGTECQSAQRGGKGSHAARPPRQAGLSGAPVGAKPSVGQTNPSKRRPDDTLSPQAGPKKVRTGPTPPRKAPSYSEVAKSDLLVAITTEYSHQLAQPDAELVMLALQKAILKIDGSGQNISPGFKGKPIIIDGVLKLWCDDEPTLVWLRETIKDINIPSGEKLILIRQCDIRFITCGLHVPGSWPNASDIAVMLRIQNPWARVDRWKLLAVEEAPAGTFCILNVPEATVKEIVARERRLRFNLGSVYIRFKGKGGKFTENYPGHEPSATADPEASTSKGSTTVLTDPATPTPAEIESLLVSDEESGVAPAAATPSVSTPTVLSEGEDEEGWALRMASLGLKGEGKKPNGDEPLTPQH